MMKATVCYEFGELPQNNFPAKDNTVICFAHPTYQMASKFEQRQAGIRHFQAWTPTEVTARIGQADVLVVSGFWRNDLLDNAPRLKFIQSVSAGYDQYPLTALKQQGIRLTSARGVNRNAVSEHVMAHILTFTRHIHIARDNQRRHFWRGMLANPSQREDELGGKAMLIIGLGAIGSRVARLAKAFDMRVIATKRNPATAEGPIDEVHPPNRLPELLPRADFVVLTCPLTPETENLIDRQALALMKSSAYLINVARGRCVDEPTLLEALHSGSIAGAGIDHFWDEPLPEDSPFWDMENVLITPHSGGETALYEEKVIDILLENLQRLWRGQQELRNQVV
jgi:phosphoglycerate dehydrogenase-like enzyme